MTFRLGLWCSWKAPSIRLQNTPTFGVVMVKGTCETRKQAFDRRYTIKRMREFGALLIRKSFNRQGWHCDLAATWIGGAFPNEIEEALMQIVENFCFDEEGESDNDSNIGD